MTNAVVKPRAHLICEDFGNRRTTHKGYIEYLRLCARRWREEPAYTKAAMDAKNDMARGVEVRADELERLGVEGCEVCQAAMGR